MLLIYVLIVVLGNTLCNYFLTFIKMKIKLLNDLLSKYFDNELNKKSMLMDYENCENAQIRDLIEKSSRGMSNYTNGISDTMEIFSSIIANIITFTSVIIIIITAKTPLLIVFALVGIIISLIINNIQNKKEFAFNDEMTRFNRRFSYFYFDLIHFKYAKDIRLYEAQKMIKDVCEADNEYASSKFKKLYSQFSRLASVINIYTIIEKILSYSLLVYYVLEPPYISIADLIMLLVAIETFTNSTVETLKQFQMLRMVASYQNYYIDFMNLPIKKLSGEIIPDAKIEKIEFKNVSFKYPNSNVYVLKNINLTINPHEKLSIVGMNGAGKTTLIKLLCRLYDVTEGEILVNEINIKDYDYYHYLKLFSVVFQDFKIISFKVKNNIEILNNNQDKLYDALSRAGIMDKIASLPYKEDTYVNKWFDKEGVEFSGGEMQKLAIARALYKDGSIVILDEPTAALDPVTEAEIYVHFNDVIGNKPTIFISHRLSSCKFCDRIIVIDQNMIVEEGTHQELMNIKDGIYNKMFNAQAQYYK